VTVVDGVQQPPGFRREYPDVTVVPRSDDLRAVVREQHTGAREIAHSDPEQLLERVHRPDAHVVLAGRGEHLAIAVRERQVVDHGRVTREQARDVEVTRPDREQLAVHRAHQHDAIVHQLYACHRRIDVGRPDGYQQRAGGRRQPGVPVASAARTRAAVSGLLLHQLDDAVPGTHQHRTVRHQVQRRDALAVQFHGGGDGATPVPAGRRVLGEAADQRRRVGGRHHGRVRRKVEFDFHHVAGAGAAVRVLVQRIDDGAQYLALDLGERTVQPLDVALLPVERTQPEDVVAGHDETLTARVHRPEHRRRAGGRPDG